MPNHNQKPPKALFSIKLQNWCVRTRHIRPFSVPDRSNGHRSVVWICSNAKHQGRDCQINIFLSPMALVSTRRAIYCKRSDAEKQPQAYKVLHVGGGRPRISNRGYPVWISPNFGPNASYMMQLVNYLPCSGFSRWGQRSLRQQNFIVPPWFRWKAFQTSLNRLRYRSLHRRAAYQRPSDISVPFSRSRA